MKYHVYRIGYEIIKNNSELWKATLVGTSLEDIEATISEYIKARVDSGINVKMREHLAEIDLISDGIVEKVQNRYFEEEVEPLLKEKEKLEEELKLAKSTKTPKKKPAKKAMKKTKK